MEDPKDNLFKILHLLDEAKIKKDECLVCKECREYKVLLEEVIVLSSKVIQEQAKLIQSLKVGLQTTISAAKENQQEIESKKLESGSSIALNKPKINKSKMN